jgi:hypothetical protein
MILKVQVGSHALAGPESDRDFRTLFVTLATDLFRLQFKYPVTSWKKGKSDEAPWEIAHRPDFGKFTVAGGPPWVEWGANLGAFFMNPNSALVPATNSKRRGNGLNRY